MDEGMGKEGRAQSRRSERAINFAVDSSILRFLKELRSLWPLSIEWKFEFFSMRTDSISLKRSLCIKSERPNLLIYLLLVIKSTCIRKMN